MTTLKHVHERLTEIRPPGFGRDIVALGMVRHLDLTDGIVTIELQPPAMPANSLNACIADLRHAVGALDGVCQVDVRVSGTPGAAAASDRSAFAEHGPLPGVRAIIAISSTKGGVGKSTVAANLALALAHLGRRVGLLDADVHGPSLPILFGLSARPGVSQSQRLIPLEKFGLRLMSVGFFVDESTPVIWRGPMVMGLVRQFLKDVEWGELDVLVVDMPPGTGDAALTLVQQVPLVGAVVVTTPQDVAILDVRRGIAMFSHVNTPVLGIIENMSYFHCQTCGHDDPIFGSGGGKRLADEAGVPLLGRIPLVLDVRAGGDHGRPIVVDRPNHPVTRQFVQIAGLVDEAIAAERQRSVAPTIIG